MRGRAQAAVVALVGSLLPLISTSAVGLVGLRKGFAEGALVALWALLPGIAGFYLHSVSPAIPLVSIAIVLVTVVAAQVLRLTRAWEWTLVAISLAATVFSLLGAALFEEVFSQGYQVFVESWQQAETEGQQVVPPSFQALLGIVAFAIALQVLLTLMLSRWWQALLYNPGGFGSEMHQLRVSPQVAIALTVVALLASIPSEDAVGWAVVVLMPLLVAGLALVHFSVALKGLGAGWLIVLYIALLLLQPLSTLIFVIVGLVDSFINIRSRLNAPKAP